MKRLLSVGRKCVYGVEGEWWDERMAWRSFKSMGSMYRQRRVFGTESTRQLHQWDGYDTNYEARSGWTGPRGGRLARRLFQMGDKDEKRRGEDGTGDGSRERIAGGRGGGRGRERGEVLKRASKCRHGAKRLAHSLSLCPRLLE